MSLLGPGDLIIGVAIETASRQPEIASVRAAGERPGRQVSTKVRAGSPAGGPARTCRGPGAGRAVDPQAAEARPGSRCGPGRTGDHGVRQGTFVIQHSGLAEGTKQSSYGAIVPGSGTGRLTGISGHAKEVQQEVLTLVYTL
ncbi:DUF3224 domain-containing protein [Saccharopolyspora sp. NPDC003752]